MRECTARKNPTRFVKGENIGMSIWKGVFIKIILNFSLYYKLFYVYDFES